MSSILKWILSRTFILYVALFALSLPLIDYKTLNERIMIRTLNHNIPLEGFGYLLRLGEGTGQVAVEQKRLEGYVRYYEKVVKYVPNLADAHGMLAFSYFYLDQGAKAQRELEKAGVLNPHFFYFQYNLGVIHFLNEDYAKAAKYFATAREKKAELAVLAIKNGIEYQRALRGITNMSEIIMVKLKSAYTECYRLLIISHLKQQHYREALTYSREAIELGLGQPEVFYYYAGLATHQLKQYEVSLALLQQAIKIDPGYAEVYHCLGLNLKALGKDDMAAAAAAMSIKLIKEQKNKRPKENEAYLRII